MPVGLQDALTTVARAAGVARPDDTDYVKRVIGIPGDRVACCTPEGRVTVQPAGVDVPIVLDEPYVFEDDDEPFCAAGVGAELCPVGAEGVLVPEGRLWVMGDHRSASSDSRAHLADRSSGTVPQDEVVGRAFAIVWPLGRIGLLPSPETFQQPSLHR
jgi:signal peptidase I